MKKDAPWGGTIYHPASIVERLRLEDLFAMARPLEVELGSGDGSFLVERARLHPELNFIGVERLFGRLKKQAKKGLRLGLDNLRLLRIEASYFTEYLLPAGSVGALHIYFPDPWPKRKHRKNRLINDRFTGVAWQALTPQGVVYLRTDDADYFAQMTAAFQGNRAFQSVETPPDMAALLTDFERDFNAQGVTTLRAAYQRIG